jgi:hypothetical protein
MKPLVLLILLVSGCSILASKEATVACQAADTVTTVVALNSASAHEANPLMSVVIKNLGLPGFVLVKLLITWALIAYHDEIHPTALAGINVATCGIAGNNAAILVR